MSLLNTCLDDLHTRLEGTLQNRVVSRNWKDRESHHLDNRELGVITILYRGETSVDDYFNYINVLILGVIELDVKASGFEVEQAEMDMIDELRCFSLVDIGSDLTIDNIVTSHQVEAPNGWFVAECRYGPFHVADADRYAGDAPGGVLISRAPDIGIGHEDDYQNVDSL